MNTKVLLVVAAAAGGLLLFAGGASAAEPDPGPPPEPEPQPDPDPQPPTPPDPEPDPLPESKHPPNVSGDPKGYNSDMFKTSMMVRQWFVNLGYSVNQFSSDPVVKLSAVRQFQRQYNKVAAKADELSLLGSLYNGKRISTMGKVTVNGTATASTLNALEIAYLETKTNQQSWKGLVNEAKALG